MPNFNELFVLIEAYIVDILPLCYENVSVFILGMYISTTSYRPHH